MNDENKIHFKMSDNNRIKPLKQLFALLMAMLVSLTSHADLLNGDFESWIAGTPTDWTTVDSGINVTQNNTITKTNASSAAITVNTKSQSSTDFRQVMSVVSGQNYQVSTWVYHTEGGVRARLYVDGFRNYSSAGLVNQWQQISYTYNATSSKDIFVGLRFYDTSGFDGSETVYVDDFQPTTSGGGGGGGGNAGCQNTDITLTLNTDNYASETSWSITDNNQSNVANGSGYQNNTSNVETYCLADGNYTFTINDSFGDGICCAWGNGSYDISAAGVSLISGGSFATVESKTFTLGNGGGGGGNGGGGDAATYYDSITTQTGFALKTALFNLINNHVAQGYSALWGFYASNSLDRYYENDGSILDIYSEKPNASESYTYTKITDQCGSFNAEGSCYNREHTFPRSWFGGSIEPMNSDVHHIFATDGLVNSKRGSFPYGQVGSASFISTNGSKLGSSITFGYSGTVFEPIDEFKGDVARGYFYLATRYQNVIGSWQNNSASVNAVLDGSNNQVFETWQLNLLKSWHNLDPVSQKEIDRNNAAHSYQGNRNPFVDHPEYVDLIWVN